MSCGGQLRARDLVPVLSWLFLRGRCRSCGGAISIQYPLVEVGTSLLFALIGSAPLQTWAQLIFLVIAALLILIFVYDLRHTIIPDVWSLSFTAIAFVVMFPRSFEMADIWIHVLSGPLVALPLFLLWYFSGGRWMGLGDPKLALGIGYLLGPLSGLGALFYAFIIGAAISVCVLLPLPRIIRALREWGIHLIRGGTSYTMKSEVPFGPFLIASCLILWIAQMYGIWIPLPWELPIA